MLIEPLKLRVGVAGPYNGECTGERTINGSIHRFSAHIRREKQVLKNGKYWSRNEAAGLYEGRAMSCR